MKPRLMWAVKRDGEIYAVSRTRWFGRHALFRQRKLEPQHKWSFCRVRVTPLKTKAR
jgi:hypothetical protein